ncbi:MAG TPA: preprotein translocase subunit SecG [Pirellulaceae bacterium]
MGNFAVLATWTSTLFGVLLFLVALFLILLILIQRGRGGGLSGAFGGMGGQSAFGSKAGDAFTRITIVVATIWMTLCVLGVLFLGRSEDPLANGSAIDQANTAEGTTEEPAAGNEADKETNGGSNATDASDTPPEAATSEAPESSTPPADR